LTHPTHDPLHPFNCGATAHVSAAHFSLSLSLSLSHATWGPAVNPSRLLPPIPSPAPAMRASPARFQSCTMTPASGQEHPAAFPHRTARGTSWSSLHPLPCRCHLCASVAAVIPEARCTTMSSLQHDVSCRMPCSPPLCRITACIATTWRVPFTAWEPLPSIPPPPAWTTARGQGCQLCIQAT
jgi:hypothetical protein